MKRFLFAGAFALLAGGQALAADLPPPPGPAPRAPAVYLPPPAVYNWTGIYIGVNGGYGFGNSTWNTPLGNSGSFNTTGFVGGGTLGGNYQMGSFVVGIEGDGEYNGLSGTTSSAGCFAIATGTTCQTSSTWLATLRGRAGYAWDRILFYGTGGGAYGNVKATSGGFTDTNNEFGWTAGAGIEAAFAPNWTAKVEYLYVSLQNGSCTITGSCAFGGGGGSVSFNENIIRAGVNYKFNWW
jgi:outer membrane immunogenic protein